jgi:four helix bundle protein
MPQTIYDLKVFRCAVDLVARVYDMTATFPRAEQFGLSAQLRRASIGVMSQIAEGQGRLTFGEWRQFLSQARGSLFEVEAQCFVACRLGFISVNQRDEIFGDIRMTGGALLGLIRWVQNRERQKHASQPRNLGTSQPTRAAPQ